MKNMFNYIMTNYLTAKKEDFRNHPVASFIRNKAVNIISEKAYIDETKYRITGSAGMGQWTHFPWIAIFDIDITTSAQRGFYPVYLFTEDMRGVYLSLNQGWTYFKGEYGTRLGIKNISIVSKFWKEKLFSNLSDFEEPKISIITQSLNHENATGYERGHIMGTYYDLKSLPDTKNLVNDLRNLLGVYREMKGIMGNNSFESMVDKVINKQDSLDNEDGFYSIEPDRSHLEIRDKSVLITPSQVDFLELQKQQKELGLSGEELIIKYEQNKLISAGRPDLAQKVLHESKEHGDGAGYDILSFNSKGDTIFIEVKTTTRDIHTTFFFSENERRFSDENGSSYKLYRIYDYKEENDSFAFYIIEGSMSKTLDLEPTAYYVKNIHTKVQHVSSEK